MGFLVSWGTNSDFLNPFLQLIRNFLPQRGRKLLTIMPQRVIFSLDRHAALRQNRMHRIFKRRRHPARRTQMAKKKSKEIQNDIMESAHKVWLAGLGAVAMAEQEGGKFFSNLMEQGQKIENKSKKQVEKAKGTVSGMKTVAESYWETFGRTVDDQMTAVIHRIGVPTKDEIETLTKKVEDLTVAVDNLRTKSAAKPKTTAKKTIAKKAPATKATAPKKAAAKK
jgi:poly(hydroxyalkanoate) granule-associated protein